MTLNQKLERIEELAGKGYSISVDEVRELMRLISRSFRQHLIKNGFDPRQITRLTTKLRDAGRRSPPWKPHSSRVPGRPQDGADGNRTNRWLLDQGHKFYADEINSTLVEVKYYLQCLSMADAPPLPNNALENCFSYLMEHDVKPNEYVDPIQRNSISINDVLENARVIQSGHIVPLDRGGRHDPANTFLMLKRSNQLQGNLTVDELLDLMEQILRSHNRI